MFAINKKKIGEKKRLVLTDVNDRLAKYGFLSDDGKKHLKGIKTPEEKEKKIDSLRKAKITDNLGDEEMYESLKGWLVPQGYPKPKVHYRMIVESHDLNVEESYHWFLEQMKVDFAYKVEKVVDTYTASEASSYFGLLQSRLGAQQSNVSNYLKGISEMVKGLFQIVREIRLINTRLELYNDTGYYEIKDNKIIKKDKKKDHNISEMTLKDVWVSQVEGGTKNPASVLGLAQTVGFTILPDLFYKVIIKDEENIDEEVEALKFNFSVRRVLKEKLKQYYLWKKESFRELDIRKKFMVRYLRQHYDTVLLYLSWIKPYLRYIRKLQGGGPDKMDNEEELISSFEGTFIEIEVLGRTPGPSHGKFYPISVLSIEYRVKPETSFSAQEYQHKGPIHIGRMEVNLRGYSWTEEQVQAYKKFRMDDNLELLSSIDDSIKSAIDSLGDELKNYLKEAGEKFETAAPPEEKKKKEDTMTFTQAVEPFTGVFFGFVDIFKGFGIGGFDFSGDKKNAEEQKYKDDNDKKGAEGIAKGQTWLMYKNYKKGHKLLTF